MKLSEIVDALDATLLTGEDRLDDVITRCGGVDCRVKKRLIGIDISDPR